MNQPSAKPHWRGHRDRLRGKLIRRGAGALEDYELLETLLFAFIPRRDVKPIAKALLRKFGSLSAILAADPKMLVSVEGVGETVAAYINATQEIGGRAAREKLTSQPVISSWAALLTYVRGQLQHETREQFRVLFLDRKNQIIADELMGQGTVDQAPVYPREIARRAIELSSSAIIMVHNHPSGDPKPSRADIDMTREVIDALAPLEIAVHDSPNCRETRCHELERARPDLAENLTGKAPSPCEKACAQQRGDYRKILRDTGAVQGAFFGRLCMSDTATAAANGHETGYGSKGYRTYVLLALMVVYTLNFIDRNLIGVLAEPIITTFNLSDTQFGLLASWPFAIFYAVMGLPIAMAADRFNRVNIIVICIVLWSVMTALCGIAAGFITLMLFRIGVAVGEAGCTPPANSIIGDYYPAKNRATALGIYSMGVTLGGVLAYLFGGPLAELSGPAFGAWLNSIGVGGLFSGIDWQNVEGWRIAFVVIGLPGIVIGAILWWTVQEPPRGYSDPPNAQKLEKASTKETLQELASKPSFWWMSAGAALVAFVGYGLFTFQIPFLIREHGLGVREASINFGAPLSALAAVGTFLGGYLTDKFSHRFSTAVAMIPAIGLLLAVPLYIFAFYATNLTVVFIVWGIAAICHYAYLGAQYNIGQGVVSVRSRATAIAILLIIVSIIGNGIGPQFVGIMSDVFTSMNLSGEGLSASLCAARDGLTEEQLASCATGRSAGLKQSISVTTLWFIVAAFCFWMSSRYLEQDLVAKAETA